MTERYPTEVELKKIEAWTVHEGWLGLMEYVRALWAYAEWGWEDEFEGDLTIYSISTGGWSGNEEIIYALQANSMFWDTCWQSSIRGGGFVFKVVEYAENKD